MFFPSTHPSLPSSCRNTFSRTSLPEAVLLSRKPMRKIIPAWCASVLTEKVSSTAATKIENQPAFFNSHLVREGVIQHGESRREKCYLRHHKNKILRGETG